jgi:iron complex outermembrane receptor protein
VSTYREGLWQPPVTTAASFYDIASIEVLRGPQGTFVGSNSTGGAIFINSRSPDFDGVHGRVEALAGNYADVGANGAINLPIDGKWAARIAFNVERRNSFYNDIGSKVTPDGATFNTPGALDEKDMRLGLLWKPSESLQVLLKSEISDRSTGGYAMQPTPTTTYAPFAPADPFTLNYDQNTKNDELTARNSLEIKWQPSAGGITFRSLTGYQYMSIRNIYDIDATSASLPAGPPAQSEFQNVIERPISEEVNILSPDNGPLTWIVGGYYLHDTRQVGLDIRNQAFPPHVFVNLFTTIQDEAVFGQVSYRIFPRLELQIGGRYTHDSLDNPAGNGVNVGPGVVFIPGTGSHTDGVWTGKAALNWTVTDDNFLYAFAAKGYKAGGFDTGFVPVQFKPEVVWDYEIGWKSYFFDRHVRTQIGGFWNNYQDLQVSVLHPPSGMISLDNIGKSTIKGVEAQIEGQFGGLRIDAGGAYVNSKLGAISLVNTRLIPGGGAINLGPQCGPGVPAPPGCFNYSPFIVSVNGRANPYSPEWTFNAGVEYAFDLGGGATLTPRLNYAYVGSQWTTLIQVPATDRLASYGLWNATLTYRNGDWQVQGYGMNLANKTYVSGQFGNDQFYGSPRQFGLRVSRTF